MYHSIIQRTCNKVTGLSDTKRFFRLVLLDALCLLGNEHETQMSHDMGPKTSREINVKNLLRSQKLFFIAVLLDHSVA